MHFLKDRCDVSGSGSCSICLKVWIGERFDGIPEPMPDYQGLPKYHYKSVFDTSLYDDNNNTREANDFLPMPNIGSAFDEGQLRRLRSENKFQKWQFLLIFKNNRK